MKDDEAHGSAAILVVDDDEMNRDMLSRRLKKRGYTVVLAQSGPQALDLAAGQPFDLVLLDVMMPGMDGLEVLGILRRNNSVADLPVIMATAKDGSDDVVRALELGANDYVTKPLDFPVVLARVRTQLALRSATRALETAHARMKSDLEAAAAVQQALMPRNLPRLDGVRCAWSFRPCTELAGDILDVVRLDESALGLYLLDVCGHGVSAALLSVTLSQVLSHMADGSSLLMESVQEEGGSRVVRPAEVASRLNRRFPMDTATNQYFTFQYGVIDTKTRELRFVSAGHPGPIHLRRGAPPAVLGGPSLAIGWFPDTRYEEQTVALQPGDRVYFYSDGVIEGKNAAAELFDRPRLLQVLEEKHHASLEESLAALLRSIEDWCGPAGPDDDISLVAIEIPDAAR